MNKVGTNKCQQLYLDLFHILVKTWVNLLFVKTQDKVLHGCGTYESLMHMIHFGKGSLTNAKSRANVHAVDFHQYNMGQIQLMQSAH